MENYNDQPRALKVLTSIIESLSTLDEADKIRVVNSVLAFLNIGQSDIRNTNAQTAKNNEAKFSEDRSQSPKQFMMEKQPKADVERIACLAYYLTHFRDLPHFKTLDLTKLNTEAAQPKFSNPTRAAANALDYGYLAPSTKGNRQLSGGGELFVQALPDREAAKIAMTSIRPKSRKPAPSKKKSSNDTIG